MMISILDAKRDTGEWSELLVRLKGDIYFSSDWLQLHCFTTGAEACLFRYQEGENLWVYPFIIRPLPSEYGIDGYDIESAYGYGGPLTNCHDLLYAKRARHAFEQWCIEKRVIAEFCAFHPLLQNNRWMVGGMKIFEDRNTVSLQLSENEDLSSAYSRDAAYMVRRFKKGGGDVNVLSLDDHYESFVKMYRRAMEKLDATEFYYFNDLYFEELKKLIQRSGCLIVASMGEEWAAASLFMHGPEMLHYHLSANNFDVKAPGATNMILDHAARWGREKGLSSLHLGGGRTAEPKDSLFKFKRSMGNMEHSFQIGKMVHHQKLYNEIVVQWVNKNPSLESRYSNHLLKYRMS